MIKQAVYNKFVFTTLTKNTINLNQVVIEGSLLENICL